MALRDRLRRKQKLTHRFSLRRLFEDVWKCVEIARAPRGQRRKDLNSTKSQGAGVGAAPPPVEHRKYSAVSAATAEQIERAAQLLHTGALIAFPTETVYGLGADARNADAVRRVFVVKGRPAEHPAIVHLAPPDLLPNW